jgi:hypothetical protein
VIINGNPSVKAEIVVNNNISKQVNSFNYLGNTIRISNNRDLDINVKRYNRKYSTIRRTRINKTRNDTQIHFHEAMVVLTLT